MGILFAFIAFFGWGFGDFFIQKSTRKFGDWKTLFYITAFASIVLLPFVYKDIIPALSSKENSLILLATSLIILFSAIVTFEAYKRGKLSVIDPIIAIELPIATALALFIINEKLALWQFTTIFILFIGIILVSTRKFHHLKNIHLEKGVWLALFGGCLMGAVDFLFSLSSRTTSPLMTNWFTSVFLAVISGLFLIYYKENQKMGQDINKNKKLILLLVFTDIAAWIGISYSVVYVPVGIAFGISEAYIALAAVLGLYINKEKLKPHQWIGLIVVVMAAIALAYYS